MSRNKRSGASHRWRIRTACAESARLRIASCQSLVGTLVTEGGEYVFRYSEAHEPCGTKSYGLVTARPPRAGRRDSLRRPSQQQASSSQPAYGRGRPFFVCRFTIRAGSTPKAARTAVRASSSVRAPPGPRAGTPPADRSPPFCARSASWRPRGRCETGRRACGRWSDENSRAPP
jgi:hypothetical protein